jgi:hypothetical protein
MGARGRIGGGEAARARDVRRKLKDFLAVNVFQIDHSLPRPTPPRVNPLLICFQQSLLAMFKEYEEFVIFK